jgi:hypothetical protein
MYYSTISCTLTISIRSSLEQKNIQNNNSHVRELILLQLCIHQTSCLLLCLTIGHTQSAFALMLQLKVLVLKFVAINRFAASSIVISEIST